MNIDEYLSRYVKYRNTVAGLKRAIDKLREKRGFAYKASDLGCKELERRYLRKKRIFDYATRKLQAAISRIGDPKLTNYLVCKYLCGMKNDDIAESFSYCERQVYRIAVKAKKRLAIVMKASPPKPRRVDTKRRYRPLSNRSISYRKRRIR